MLGIGVSKIKDRANRKPASQTADPRVPSPSPRKSRKTKKNKDFQKNLTNH